jgi:DNA-directed RNA polymerase subunit N (RpoN/RPB10)
MHNNVSPLTMSLWPVRCFTCGKVIAHLQEKYEKEMEALTNLPNNTSSLEQQKNTIGTNSAMVMTKLGIIRWCCRRMVLGHVNSDEMQ